MELWRGLMGNHSVVAYPNNADHARLRVDFDNFLQYVPIRLPWTACVQQSLPPGAAGVLVNQTHLFPDLYLMITETERRMYDAIDGRRSIAEIVEGMNDIDVRNFFVKLWRHDQVVFDTSKVS